jgi:RimJ/RimL family protein N-acetyltransferase
MHLRLESVQRTNIGNIRAAAPESTSNFNPLPTTELGALRYLAGALARRRDHEGDKYAAFDTDGYTRLVGGGDIAYSPHTDTLSIGYWVVRDRRRQGIGGLLIRAIELEAVALFPDIETVQAHIDPTNIPSLRLAETSGYHTNGEMLSHTLVYRKSTEAILATSALADAIPKQATHPTEVSFVPSSAS